MALDADIANAKVRRWLDKVANVRAHATTGEVPMTKLAEERAVMLPALALKAPPRVAARVAMPLERLQHPLAVSPDLLESA
jgi:hypothetical protein